MRRSRFNILCFSLLVSLFVCTFTQAVAKPRAKKSKEPSTAAPVDSSGKKSVKEVVALLQKAYQTTSALKASFEQIAITTMSKRKTSGLVYLKKPGKMRWEYEKPEKKLYVADGTYVWVIESEEEPIQKALFSSSQLGPQVRFLFGRGKLEEDFTISFAEDAELKQTGNTVLKLVPKKPTNYKYLIFGVDPTTGIVKETIMYYLQGGSNHFIFSNLELDPTSGIEDSLFLYVPPKGAKVVGM